VKYNILIRPRGNDTFGEFLITPLTADAINKMDNQEVRDRHVIAKVTFTPGNRAEMWQHASKLATYFEEVDTAKEAVIRCTKL
jgi:hypothetical protein